MNVSRLSTKHGYKSNISVILCDTYYIDKDVVKRKKSKRKKLSK